MTPIDALTLTAGMRYDDHETFGNETTGQAALAWSATPTTIVRASYGEGFKAPTLFQLFSEFGNEALAPERADAWDASVEQHLLNDALVLSATYFSRNTSNMIDFVSCFPSTDPRCATRPFGFYDNVQKTDVEGFELGLVAHVSDSCGSKRTTRTWTRRTSGPARTSASSCRAVPVRLSTAS